MNKTQLENKVADQETTIIELNETIDQLRTQIDEHNTLIGETDGDVIKAEVEKAKCQIEGECKAQIEVYQEQIANLEGEKASLAAKHEAAKGKRKGVQIVATRANAIPGRGGREGDVIGSIVLEDGVTFTSLCEAGYRGRLRLKGD